MSDLINNYGDAITLTNEQAACVNYLGERTLMVKGLAGSGKSVVLQATAKKIMDEYTSSKNNAVLFLTFNKALCSATREMLDNNGDRTNYVKVVNLDSLLYEVYNNTNAPKINRIDDEYSKKGYTPKGQHTHTFFLEKAFKEHERKYGHHRFHDVDISFWKEEFEWMKEMNVTSADMTYYLTLPRRGRGGKVRMASADRVVAFQLFLEYEAELKKAGYGDWIDRALYIIRHPECVSSEYKYDYVLIDEAQDLSLAHMMAAVMFVKKRMVIAMDANQRIYNKNWTPKQLGIEATTKKLTKSMRTTIKIDNLAESVRRNNDAFVDEDDKMIRAIPERPGDQLPEVAHFDTLDEEKKYVTKIVKDAISKNSRHSIGIIAFINKQLPFYGGWMTDAGIPCEIISGDTTFSMKNPGVKICNVFNAKGLEFDIVIIPQFQERYIPLYRTFDNDEDKYLHIIKSRNLAYVAMTRAKQLLYITYNGDNGSRFIGEMDKELYISKGNITYFNDNTNQIKSSEPKIQPQTPPIIKKEESSRENYSGLSNFFESKGLKVVDKRLHGGALWVVGQKSEIDTYVREAGKLYGAYGNYVSEGKSKAINLKAGWYTKCQK